MLELAKPLPPPLLVEKTCAIHENFRPEIPRLTSQGLVVQSFDTLLEELGTRCRKRCRIQSESKVKP